MREKSSISPFDVHLYLTAKFKIQSYTCIWKLNKVNPFQCKSAYTSIHDVDPPPQFVGETVMAVIIWKLVLGRWFSRHTSNSSTNNTDHHDITEILLKVGLNTKTLALTPFVVLLTGYQLSIFFLIFGWTQKIAEIKNSLSKKLRKCTPSLNIEYFKERLSNTC